MQDSIAAAQAPMAGSSTAAADAAPTDPFQFLARHIHRRVAITLLPLHPSDPQDGGAVVAGTLLSVDDLCNVLLRNWTCTDTVSHAAGAASMQQPRKKTRTEVSAGGEEGEEESLRLIRGAQIASLSLLA